jgi:hypothetical protein
MVSRKRKPNLNRRAGGFCVEFELIILNYRNHVVVQENCGKKPNVGHQPLPPIYWLDSIRKGKNWKLMSTCALSSRLRAFVGRHLFSLFYLFPHSIIGPKSKMQNV